MQIICPYYTKLIELIPYLGKTPKMIMIYKDNNNEKDNDLKNQIIEKLNSMNILAISIEIKIMINSKRNMITFLKFLMLMLKKLKFIVNIVPAKIDE